MDKWGQPFCFLALDVQASHSVSLTAHRQACRCFCIRLAVWTPPSFSLDLGVQTHPCLLQTLCTLTSLCPQGPLVRWVLCFRCLGKPTWNLPCSRLMLQSLTLHCFSDPWADQGSFRSSLGCHALICCCLSLIAQVWSCHCFCIPSVVLDWLSWYLELLELEVLCSSLIVRRLNLCCPRMRLQDLTLQCSSLAGDDLAQVFWSWTAFHLSLIHI